MDNHTGFNQLPGAGQGSPVGLNTSFQKIEAEQVKGVSPMIAFMPVNTNNEPVLAPFRLHGCGTVTSGGKCQLVFCSPVEFAIPFAGDVTDNSIFSD